MDAKAVFFFVYYTSLLNAEIISGPSLFQEDFCTSQPCGEGNTCFSTSIGFKCFCRPGYETDNCLKEEPCLLFNHTGVCRHECLDRETGFFISHLGGRFMDLKIYNKDGTTKVAENVPVVDIREQVPCMWQLSGKPNCCVDTEDVKIGCFAYGSKVKTESRGLVPIEELRTGDRVESINEQGQMFFDDVIMIMHQEPDREEEMVAVTGSTGVRLTLTHDHLLLTSTDSDGISWQFMFSQNALPGMLIRVQTKNGMIIDQITKVERIKQKGLYAPVTVSGSIIIDSVAASCYGNHPDHYLSHLMFSPIRWLYRWTPWMYDGDAVTEDGSHPYVSFLNRHLRALTGFSLVSTQYRLDSGTYYP